MLTKFWESIGEGLSEKWLSHLFGPAFLFWMGGVVAWGTRNDLIAILDELNQLDGLQAGIFLATVLFIVAASGYFIQAFTMSILRFLEGYWPHFLTGVREFLTKRDKEQQVKNETRWSELNNQGHKQWSTVERQEFIVLDQQLHYMPSNPENMMPTKIGNILRAAEISPSDKFGLDAVVCWPRLWMVLPEGVKEDLSAARTRLDQLINLWTWSVLFIIWSIWAWWAFPVGVLLAWVAYRQACVVATTYADLVEAAFDLYRWEMYAALHYPFPPRLSEEVATGQALTEYLWRGAGKDITFAHPNKI